MKPSDSDSNNKQNMRRQHRLQFDKVYSVYNRCCSFPVSHRSLQLSDRLWRKIISVCWHAHWPTTRQLLDIRRPQPSGMRGRTHGAANGVVRPSDKGTGGKRVISQSRWSRKKKKTRLALDEQQNLTPWLQPTKRDALVRSIARNTLTWQLLAMRCPRCQLKRSISGISIFSTNACRFCQDGVCQPVCP